MNCQQRQAQAARKESRQLSGVDGYPDDPTLSELSEVSGSSLSRMACTCSWSRGGRASVSPPPRYQAWRYGRSSTATPGLANCHGHEFIGRPAAFRRIRD